jgi:competence protein ComEC
VFLWRADTPPLAIISEDARQFAVIEPAGGGMRLHVNRTRPNAFTLEQWMDAYRGTEIVKPGDSDRMRCEEKFCIALADGPTGSRRIAYVNAAAEDLPPVGALSARALCAGNDVVIFAKAPSSQSCVNGTPVLSAQMLALNGAAEIRPNGKKDGLLVRQALPGPVRPWLDHRRYSRAARNLGEWKPRGDGQ